MERTFAVKLAEALQGVIRLGLDTSPFIYLVEARGQRDSVVFEVFRRIDAEEVVGVTSVISLAEVLVQPTRVANYRLYDRYRELLLESRGLQCLGIDESVAEMAARLQVRYGLRLPDAL